MSDKEDLRWMVLVTPREYDEDELMACIKCDEQSIRSDVAKTYISLMIWSKSVPQ